MSVDDGVTGRVTAEGSGTIGRQGVAGPSVAVQRRRLSLLGADRPVGRGRLFADQALRDWGRDAVGPRTDDVLLIVSELVANACLHAGGPHELVLAVSPAGLRVEVWDGLTELPKPRPAHLTTTPGGHGLHIVERLSDTWGSVPHATGKAVWAEIGAGRLLV